MKRKCVDCKADISMRHHKCVRCRNCQTNIIRARLARYQAAYQHKHKTWAKLRTAGQQEFQKNQSYMTRLETPEPQNHGSCVLCGAPAEDEMCEACEEKLEKYQEVKK